MKLTPLAREVRRIVNKATAEHGRIVEERLRQVWTSDLQSLRAAGATFDELCAHARALARAQGTK